jgi:predicted phage baseplate assembly protein
MSFRYGHDVASIGPTTPLSVDNRPGLPALMYRVGTHASFFETMKARLSTFVSEDSVGGSPPLSGLTTRNANDPAIAMLDAWALIADVLTFYQERIANEGYLRTAVERRSIQSLAALVGYALRPGVAASVYLAYGVEDPGDDETVLVPADHRVQSMPEPGALPQTFETSAPLVARASWNRLKPRLNRPQQAKPESPVLYFKGVATNLKPNDPLLFVKDDKPVPGELARVASVEPQFSENRTKVTLQRPLEHAIKRKQGQQGQAPMSEKDLLDQLALPPAQHPRRAVDLVQDVRKTLSPSSDAAPQLLSMFKPALRSQLYVAISNAQITSTAPVEVHAFRVHAAPFGHNAPLEAVFDENGKLVTHREWTLQKPVSTAVAPEQFKIEVSIVAVATLASPVVIQVTVQINGHSPNTGNNRATHDIITIKDQEARETVVIKIEDQNINEAQIGAKSGLTFSFERRRITISLTEAVKEGENDIVAVARGCDPIVVTITQADGSAVRRHGLLGAPLRGQRPFITITGITHAIATEMVTTEDADKVSLDNVYERVIPNSWVAIERPDEKKAPITSRVQSVASESRADYGLTGRNTHVTLGAAWLGPLHMPAAGAKSVGDEDFTTVIRGTSIYAESEQLELADAPIGEDLAGGVLELDGVYGALEPGRWLIVQGERIDVPGTSGIHAAELVMLAGVDHGAASDIPGEKMRTRLTLVSPLAYRYLPESVEIFGNVVHATHGETRSEVLGSGDGSQGGALFALHLAPLTYVSADTPRGSESSLRVRVNEVLWHETERLNDLGPNDRRYVTREAVDGRTLIAFGNGSQGARLPTGIDNIKAVYRSGLGAAGNVPAGKVNLLVTRPANVSSVINPLPANGGADHESQDAARRNTPLALMALDRLVSVQDYADFARTFAGVDKACATRIAVGHRQTVYLTVAGTDEEPLDESSDLCVNLAKAVMRYGDPHQPLVVKPSETVLLVLVAQVRVEPDHQWAVVAPGVRAALLDRFGYAQREIGQDVVLSEVISTIQNVSGVDYVDVDRMDSTTAATLMPDLHRISGEKLSKPRPNDRVRALPVRLANGDGGVRMVMPAQVVYLSATVSSLLTLTELT